MELRKEYAEIVERARKDTGCGVGSYGHIAAEEVALACQELADRPPRELTDAEIDKLWRAGFSRPEGDYTAPRRFIAAFLAKQREPQVVKFRAVMNKESGAIEMLRDGDSLPTTWCFLEPAQEFEVRI